MKIHFILLDFFLLKFYSAFVCPKKRNTTVEIFEHTYTHTHTHTLVPIITAPTLAMYEIAAHETHTMAKALAVG